MLGTEAHVQFRDQGEPAKGSLKINENLKFRLHCCRQDTEINSILFLGDVSYPGAE